jgi:hypothetical protein
MSAPPDTCSPGSHPHGALSGNAQRSEIERCPHCGGVVRLRGIGSSMANAVNAWLDEQAETQQRAGLDEAPE